MKSGKNHLFIAGPPRTGTTLLTKLLNEHSSISLANETHCFSVLEADNDFWAKLKKGEVEKVLERLRSLHEKYYGKSASDIRPKNQFNEKYFKKIFDEASQDKIKAIFYRHYLKSVVSDRQSEYVGEKTPRHVFKLTKILKIFPDAKILLTLRDGRDFLASYKNAWRSKEGDNKQRLKKIYDPILTSLIWKLNVGRIQEFYGDERVRLIRYEDLVKNPRKELGGLFDRLSIDRIKDFDDFEFNNSSYDEDETGSSPTEALSTQSIGKWEDELEDFEVYLFEWINRKFFDVFEYESSSMDVPLLPLGAYLARSPYSIGEAIWANRSRIPNPVDYVSSRLF